MPFELSTLTKAAEVVTKISGGEKLKHGIDVAKRIDATKEIAKNKDTTIDVTKRIIPKEMSVDDNLRDYISDLKNKSKFSDTISDKVIDSTKLEVVDTKTVEKLRDEFDDKKKSLIAEWEKKHDTPWPRYTEKEIKDLNITDRKPGDRYDAHHIKPLKGGGTNEVDNITPLDRKSHSEIHSKDGSCKKLVDSLGE